MTRVVDMADPARGEDTGEFQGVRHGAGVSFIVVDAPPGSGPRLHRHPYEEVFVVQEGSVKFTAGDEVVEVSGGQVVVVPAGVAHKFVNSGAGRLRQVDIHASERFVTEWLEDWPRLRVLRQALRVLQVSNPDADHIGGLLDVFDAFEVWEVYGSGDLKGTLAYETFLRGVEGEGPEVEVIRAGRLLYQGGVRADVLGSLPGELFSETNDNSLAILLTYATARILLAGDAKVVEEE